MRHSGKASTPEKEALRKLRLSLGKRKPLETITKQLSDKLIERDYEFIGFKEGYENARSKIIARCKKHGDWELNINKALSGRGCPNCRTENNRIRCSFTSEEAFIKISKILQLRGFSFVKWVDSYVNQKSKVVCNCLVHGDWVTSFVSICNQKTGCPACGNYGFSSNMKGYLYCLVSEGGDKVKIGITNNVAIRIKQLCERTPFDFNVLEVLSFEDGARARELESLFHQHFESAKLKGFDGSTEWLLWTPMIQRWLRFFI